jgi:ribonuclease-3
VPYFLDSIYSQGKKPTYSLQILSLHELSKKLNYTFKNSSLLLNALTHTSFTNENVAAINSSNERLEFLGDSIINQIITISLFQKYPEMNEGELSRLRGALVNEKIFSDLARLIKLNENIFLGKGELKQQGQEKNSLLADTFEALMGAIYLDSNLASVEKTIIQIFELYKMETGLDFISESWLENFDSKTKLQEICMELFKEHPRYEAAEIEQGFRVTLWLKDKCLLEKSGLSKKKLEKELAKIVLEEKSYQI